MAEQVTGSIIVGVDVATAYALWADFQNFPRFMKNIRSVTLTGSETSHWVMNGPLGKDVEWDARVTRLEPNKRIAWTSSEESDVRTSGQVTFNALGPQETEITVMMHYVPPAGAAGEAIAKLLSDPAGQLEEDIRNFKAYAEGRLSAAGTR
jgi:uncharacterized membrane protein